LHETSKRKANWIGYNLRRTAFYNGLLKERYKGGIKVTERRERKRRKLLDELKERRGYPYWKEEALDRTMWSARFGRGFGPFL
jgi:hypothetical protein